MIYLSFTIEPTWDMLLPAALAACSLREHCQQNISSICRVVCRGGSEKRAADRAAMLDAFQHICIVAPFPDNPYMNKYVALDELPSGTGDQLVIADHDLVAIATFSFPISVNECAARVTPRKVWESAAEFERIARVIPGDAWYFNSGLIIVPKSCASRFEALVVQIHGQIDAETPAWFREQSAVSLALSELGARPLAAALNYTPWSPRPPGEVAIVHYNHSSEFGPAMRSAIARTGRVQELLIQLGCSQSAIETTCALRRQLLSRVVTRDP